MALDALLLDECCREGGAVLRFYSWEPPAVSIGRFQEAARGIDLAACRRRGLSVVRRMTGGRAVIHHREVTYSIASAWGGDFPPTGVTDLYDRIAEGLLHGLDLLGVAASKAGRHSSAPTRASNCFKAPSRCEIVHQGRKLVGSAQVRSPAGFLQHGSILLEVDAGLWEGVFGPGAADGVASVAGILGRPVPAAEVEAALGEGFARIAGRGWRETPLPARMDRAARLTAPRFLVDDPG
jgi:lipoate-protein ligase A